MDIWISAHKKTVKIMWDGTLNEWESNAEIWNTDKLVTT